MKKRSAKIAVAVVLIAMLALVFLPGQIDAVAAQLTCKQKVSDSDAGAFNVRCRGATIYYGAGTCAGKCVGNPALPIDAKEALDALYSTAASFVYLRMVDENKQPVDYWTTICFAANTIDNVHNPRLRYYVPSINSWVPTYYRFDPDTGAMCTDYRGDFSIAVVGVAK